MKPRPRRPAPSIVSQFQSGLAVRLGFAAGLAGPLWLAIVWTLGT